MTSTITHDVSSAASSDSDNLSDDLLSSTGDEVYDNSDDNDEYSSDEYEFSDDNDEDGSNEYDFSDFGEYPDGGENYYDYYSYDGDENSVEDPDDGNVSDLYGGEDFYEDYDENYDGNSSYEDDDGDFIDGYDDDDNGSGAVFLPAVCPPCPCMAPPPARTDVNNNTAFHSISNTTIAANALSNRTRLNSTEDTPPAPLWEQGRGQGERRGGRNEGMPKFDWKAAFRSSFTVGHGRMVGGRSTASVGGETAGAGGTGQGQGGREENGNDLPDLFGGHGSSVTGKLWSGFSQRNGRGNGKNENAGRQTGLGSMFGDGDSWGGFGASGNGKNRGNENGGQETGLGGMFGGGGSWGGFGGSGILGGMGSGGGNTRGGNTSPRGSHALGGAKGRRK